MRNSETTESMAPIKKKVISDDASIEKEESFDEDDCSISSIEEEQSLLGTTGSDTSNPSQQNLYFSNKAISLFGDTGEYDDEWLQKDGLLSLRSSKKNRNKQSRAIVVFVWHNRQTDVEERLGRWQRNATTATSQVNCDFVSQYNVYI